MKKKNITICMSEDIISRLRDAVYWMPGMTISSLVETGVKNYIRGIEIERGSKFLAREHELSKGRKSI